MKILSCNVTKQFNRNPQSFTLMIATSQENCQAACNGWNINWGLCLAYYSMFLQVCHSLKVENNSLSKWHSSQANPEHCHCCSWAGVCQFLVGVELLFFQIKRIGFMGMFLLLICLVRFSKMSLWRAIGKNPELRRTLRGNTDWVCWEN